MIEMRMHDDARRRVVRANMTYVAILVPLLAVSAVSTAISTRNAWFSLAYLALALAMFPLTYVLARRMVDRARIVLGDGTYAVHGWGRPKRFTVADVERVVTVDRTGFAGTAPTHHLIVLGPTRRLLLLVGQMWDREQLSTVALDLANRGVPLVPFHQPVTPAQLRAIDPRLVPWRQAHPVALGLLVGLGVILVLVVAFVVLVALLLR